jgi:hypothetical protein
MKGFFHNMYHLYFFERTAYHLFFIGIVLLAFSFFLSNGAEISLIISLILLAGFPLVTTSAVFIDILSNRHLALVPNWRLTYLAANAGISLLLGGLISFTAHFVKEEFGINAVNLFATIFCFSSFYLLALFIFLKIRFLPLVLIFLGWLFKDELQSIWISLPSLNSNVMMISMIVISSSIWLGLALWLSQVTNIKKHSFIPQKRELTWYERWFNQEINFSKLSASQSLMRGYAYEKGVSLLQIGVTTLALLILLVMAAWPIPESKSIELGLFLILFGCGFISIIVNTEWVPRLRMLWLKESGDRYQFWVLWRNRINKGLIVCIVLLNLLNLLVWLLFDVSNQRMIMCTVGLLIVLPSFNYFMVWFRLKGELKSAVASSVFLAYLVCTLFAMFLSQQEEGDLAKMLFVMLSILVWGFSYYQIKKQFLTLDWLKVKVK